MNNSFKKRSFGAAVAACFMVGVIFSPVGAEAARMITGKDIKNSSVTSVDVKDGSLQWKDLSEDAKEKLTVVKTKEVEVVKEVPRSGDFLLANKNNSVSGTLSTSYQNIDFLTLEVYPTGLKTMSNTKWETFGQVMLRPMLSTSSSAESKPVTVNCYFGTRNANDSVEATGTPDFTFNLTATKNTNQFVPAVMMGDVTFDTFNQTKYLSASCALAENVDNVSVLFGPVQASMLKVS